MKWFCLLLATALALISAPAHAESMDLRAQLATQNRDGVANIARTLTIQNWTGRINETMARTPAGLALGQAWNPNEPNWDKAYDQLMGIMMKVFDDLKSAPEAFARLGMPFQTNLTEDQAAQVLALTAAERKDLDAYSDTMALALKLLEHRSGMKIGSPEYEASLARLVKMAKLPQVPDTPEFRLLAKTFDNYRMARSASVDFMVSAMDGQLKLYWFDNSAAITQIIAKAAAAAGKAKWRH